MKRINLLKGILEGRNTETWNSETRSSENRNVNNNSVAYESVSWGRACRNNVGPLAFGAILIVCSLAVGCSSEKPQPLTSNNPAPIVPPATSTVANNNLSAPLPETKAAPKKIVKKRPATVTYNDKTYGVSFAYPRRYAIETGDATKDVLLSSPLPMNFVQPGGVALAAVELPETGYANTDFSSAFFNVSVNNTLTGGQCNEFSVPEPKPQSQTNEQTSSKTPATSMDASSAQPEAAKPMSTTNSQSAASMLDDMKLHSAEAVSGEGTRQSDSKYFHVFKNGACYEFALNVTTNAAQADATLKHVDRDRVFAKLETILSTVKIDTVEQAKAAPEVKNESSEPKKEEAAGTARSVEPSVSEPSASGGNGQKFESNATDSAKPENATPETGSTESAPAGQSAPMASAAQENSTAPVAPPQ